MLQFIAFLLLWAFLWWVFTFVAGIVMAFHPPLMALGGIIWFMYTALSGYMSYKTIY